MGRPACCSRPRAASRSWTRRHASPGDPGLRRHVIDNARRWVREERTWDRQRGRLCSGLPGGLLMRVLVLSSTFPSSRSAHPRGVFVRERIRRLGKRCDVVMVAPVPWFPLNRWIRKSGRPSPRSSTRTAWSSITRVLLGASLWEVLDGASTFSRCLRSPVGSVGPFPSRSSTPTSRSPTGSPRPCSARPSAARWS